MKSYLKHLPGGPFLYRVTAPEGRHEGSGLVHLLDANGRKIAQLWGSPDEKLALAELFIDARDNHKET